MNTVDAFDEALPAMEERSATSSAVEMVAMPLPDIDDDAQRAALPDLAYDEPGGPQWIENRVPVEFVPPEQKMFDELDARALARDPLVEPQVDPFVELDPGPTALIALLDISIPLAETAPPTKYEHRAPEVRRQTLVDRGGSLETERAVSLSLRWLARHQSKDGRWSGKDFDDNCGHCEGKSKVDADTALTGLALLCFFAADHSHVKPGPYQHVVRAGLRWLVSAQEEDGSLIAGESMYSHGIASIALAEAYGMTGDSALEAPVQKAIDFIYEARNRSFGGWRYEPGQVGDTSVLGWQIMALVSARKAGIDVPDEAFEVASKWLTKVRDPWKPGLYAYQPKRRVTPSMTAEAMFVQQMLGKYDTDEMKASAAYVIEFLPDWKRNTNTYFWYYATLSLFQHGGEEWGRWNEVVKNELLAHQATRGPNAGSWFPSGKWANVGGRVYQTALCCLTLEVYYRYLPAYVDHERVSQVQDGGFPAP